VFLYNYNTKKCISRHKFNFGFNGDWLAGKKEASEFAKKALEEFDGLIKSVILLGSFVRGDSKPESDIDIFVILDDTFTEFNQDKIEFIEGKLREIASSVSEKLSIMPLLTLTEFTDYAREGHPIVYALIKEGIPIYDVGFFIPWKRLLKAGKIPRTREALENYIDSSLKKISRAKTVKLLIVVEDCYYSMIQSAQAVLMQMGLDPPVPRRTYEALREYLVRPGILEGYYAEWLREIVDIRKKVEHKKLIELPGEQVDRWISRAEKFVKKMLSIYNMMEAKKREKILEKTYKTLQRAVAEALKRKHGLSEKLEVEEVEKTLGMTLREALEKEWVESGKIDKEYLYLWDKIEKLYKTITNKKKTSPLGEEVYTLREDTRRFIIKLNRSLDKNL